MSKRCKKQKHQKSNQCSLQSLEIRPVTKTDEWCWIKIPYNGVIPQSKAPFGYIVTIPYLPNQNIFLEDVDGYIVRSKKHCGQLLLQVILKLEAPQYGVSSYSEPGARKGRNKKRFYRILNIRNLSKSNGKF